MSAAAPIPLNERERLEVLRAFRVLDTDPDRPTDDLVAIAAATARTPMALISLVDETRQWFKARIGIDACETAREHSFCAWAIHSRDPFVIEDAHADPRFAGNPLVTGEPHVRFYAGFPLWTQDGTCLGSLCVIDRNARSLDAETIGTLERLARCVVDQLEARRLSRELADALERVRILGELVPICGDCRRVREDDEYRHTLEAWLDEQTGTQFSHGLCPECFDVRMEGLD
jgi:GAF domain-containing protein